MHPSVIRLSLFLCFLAFGSVDARRSLNNTGGWRGQNEPSTSVLIRRDERNLPATPFTCGGLSVTSFGEELGGGAFGTVYAAQINSYPFNVAVKVGHGSNQNLDPDSDDEMDIDDEEEAEPEADLITGNENARQLLSDCQHVMKVYATCTIDNIAYIITERFQQSDGKSYPSIGKRITAGVYRSRTTRESLARNDFLGAAYGVAYMHSRRCIHNDLGNTNVLVVQGVAIIIDMDDVKTFDQYERELGMESEWGTADDVNSLGILALQIVSGRKNLPGSPEEDAGDEVWARWLRNMAPEISDDLVELLAKDVFVPVEGRINSYDLLQEASKIPLFRR